jgi:hypothetical protein
MKLKQRALPVLLVIGIAVAVVLVVSIGTTVTFLGTVLRQLTASNAPPAPLPVPRVATTPPSAPVVADELAEQDDLLPGESQGERAQRVASERDPDLAALIDDPDPKVAGALRDFFHE